MRTNLSKLIFTKLKVLNFLFFLIIIFIVPIFLFSESLIRVSAEVDKSVITIGDRIHYTITVSHHRNLHIEQPGPGANLGQFEIKDYNISEKIEEGDLVTQKFEYTISVFDTGKFVIPPFPIAFAIEIYVKSVLTSENAEIKDIKPPLSVPFNYRRWIFIGLATLVIIIGALFTYYYLKQKKKGVKLFKKEVIRPAHEIALENLDTLEKKMPSMYENGEHKQFFTELSLILRTYLENRLKKQKDHLCLLKNLLKKPSWSLKLWKELWKWKRKKRQMSGRFQWPLRIQRMNQLRITL